MGLQILLKRALDLLVVGWHPGTIRFTNKRITEFARYYSFLCVLYMTMDVRWILLVISTLLKAS